MMGRAHQCRFFSSATSGPKALYAEYVQRLNLRHDARQIETVALLQNLYDQVISYHPAPEPRFWKRFTPVQAPKGLYLYGDVGTGKTMLMGTFMALMTNRPPLPFRSHSKETENSLSSIYARSPSPDSSI
jgi:predicted ATPase